MKKNILFLIVFMPYFVFSQNKINDLKNLKGTWKGSFEGYKVTANINDDKPLITFINFQNQKFNVLEGLISENKVGEIEIEIKKATLSYCEKCNFTYGKIKIICKNESEIIMNINDVGPSYWRSYDVEEGMTDINNLNLTKTQIKE
ncbi:hypothetical protein [Soonwooa purpurea]